MATPDPITRRDFQRLTRLHLSAARTLLHAHHWQSAYHVAGYALECGLKACIAKRTRRHDFPRRDARDAYTHDLTKLLSIAKLDANLKATSDASPAFDVNWTIVKDWTPESRYDHGISEAAARDFYRALTSRQNGVMTWIRQLW